MGFVCKRVGSAVADATGDGRGLRGQFYPVKLPRLTGGVEVGYAKNSAVAGDVRGEKGPGSVGIGRPGRNCTLNISL